jgi:hypothetical protein
LNQNYSVFFSCKITYGFFIIVGTITTKIIYLFLAVVTSIVVFEIKTPPKADVGSHAKAAA